MSLSPLPAEPNSSVCSIQGLRLVVSGLIPRLGQYFLQRLMIVNATGFIPFSLLFIVSAMVMWESSQWLEKNTVWSTSRKHSSKAWVAALAAAM